MSHILKAGKDCNCGLHSQVTSNIDLEYTETIYLYKIRWKQKKSTNIVNIPNPDSFVVWRCCKTRHAWTETDISD